MTETFARTDFKIFFLQGSKLKRGIFARTGVIFKPKKNNKIHKSKKKKTKKIRERVEGVILLGNEWKEDEEDSRKGEREREEENNHRVS